MNYSATLWLGLGSWLLLAGCGSSHPAATQGLMDATTPADRTAAASPSTAPAQAAAPAEAAAANGHFDPVQSDPPPDAGSIARNWPASTCYYPSGATVAYPNYKHEKDDQPEWLRSNLGSLALDPEIFVLQSVETLFWPFFNPPWSQATYTGISYPPSQTGADPLPPP